MTAEVLPDSITIWEGEQALGWVDPDLDLDYIDGVAADIAAFLTDRTHRDGSPGHVAEACYQPGDGTCYRLVFVPLRLIETARPRVKDGQTWDAHAVRGMFEERETRGGMAGVNGLRYKQDGYLVCRVEGTCYPLRLGASRGDTLAASYVEEHWDLPPVSACSVAILLRAVSHYLTAWERLGQADVVPMPAR